VEPGRDVVLVIRCDLARPHHLGHEAKKSSPNQKIGSIRKNAELKVAKLTLMHKASVPHRLYWPRICADLHGSSSRNRPLGNPWQSVRSVAKKLLEIHS